MSKKPEGDVPDAIRPYLNEIADRLWAGRAAVMIGAGFSKNASQGFPDWVQLGDIFYEKAHGAKPDPNKHKYLNVLRLAEDVQAAIGRPALENLLRSAIPDREFEPSDLHETLLNLPWVDVFTTNYDTLLERASTKVVTRRYATVVNKEDIPYAIKPRIVKLHGSFPSERPFIITEEDYRCYPREYAPFVNTVQQALLENTLCLIGFSGDDPNFLQWTGWIRDNLGKDKSQKVYLVGMFDLSPTRLQLLAQRGITAVDLSCWPGAAKHNYKHALSQFFRHMQSKNPKSLDWPDRPRTMPPQQNENREDTIKKITEQWRGERQAYPGWLILPYSTRETLWQYMRQWLYYFPSLGELTPGLDIQYAFELIWRLERCLLPILPKLAVSCEKLLERYWPFPTSASKIPSFYQFDEKAHHELPWNDIRQAWLAIALAMLRSHRENGEVDKWKKEKKRIDSVVHYLSDEQKEFLQYEGFLFDLFNLDLSGAKKLLEKWRPSNSLPYWMAKRAAALAEIGMHDKTDDQILSSLINTRQQGGNYTGAPRCLAVSNEAYQMVLLRCLRGANWRKANANATLEEEELMKRQLRDEWEERQNEPNADNEASTTINPAKKFNSFDDEWNDLYTKRDNIRKTEWDQLLDSVRRELDWSKRKQENARWDELKAFRCDPWNELQMFELQLNKPPIKKSGTTEKNGFDIGRLIRTHRIDGIDQEAFTAYSFLRFCEEVGLPFRIGSAGATVASAIGCLQRIASDSPFWAIATLMRTGDAKGVDNLFSRESIYRLTTSEADEWATRYLDALNKCREQIHTNDTFRSYNYGYRLAQVIPEVISRLCCKCSIGMRRKIIYFIIDVYASPFKVNYSNVDSLIRRLINSMSNVERYNLVPDLLEISYPGGGHTSVQINFPNPFLLLGLAQKPESDKAALEIASGLVDRLLQQAVMNDAGQRQWAIISLVTLYKLQLLTPEQSTKLGDAIWAHTDESGLPKNTGFYIFVFLNLPHPANCNPIELLKAYLRKASFPIQNPQDKGVAITHGNIPIVHEIIGAKSIWTAKDVEDILQRLLEWWNADKGRLNDNERSTAGFSSIPEEFRLRLSRIADVLSEVVIPKLGTECTDATKSSLSQLLLEMRNAGLPVITAETASLNIYPDRNVDVYKRIKESLTSNQDDIVKDGCRALEKILLGTTNVSASAVELDPVPILIGYPTWSHTHFVSRAIWIIIQILKIMPQKYSGNLEDATLKRLERLLDETSYGNNDLNMTFEERLEVRRIAAMCAGTLWKHYNSNHLSLPDTIQKWREACLSDNEFSEIKNAWTDNAME
ncbi:MAG: SIR2 family protein [Planctomycetia bacterium]|nr:SIR2 family protein [Planctomycetia bacterium]